jgi:hypothetical protein
MRGVSTSGSLFRHTIDKKIKYNNIYHLKTCIFYQKLVFTLHINILFQFWLYFNTLRWFLEMYSKLMANME